MWNVSIAEIFMAGSLPEAPRSNQDRRDGFTVASESRGVVCPGDVGMSLGETARTGAHANSGFSTTPGNDRMGGVLMPHWAKVMRLWLYTTTVS
jgi:hypothetical protein